MIEPAYANVERVLQDVAARILPVNQALFYIDELYMLKNKLENRQKTMVITVNQPDKYYANLYTPNTNDFEFVEVKGRSIKIKGFEEFDFFVHTHLDESMWGCIEYFTVTEGSSGARLGFDFDEETAVYKATQKLIECGSYNFKYLIKGHIEQWGLSPRYKYYENGN